MTHGDRTTVATKVKSSKPKSKTAKASKKGCGPKGPKKPAKPKAASKSQAKRLATQKPKAAPVVQRVVRRFPRGQSPFSSPTVGVRVFSDTHAIERLVTEVSGDLVTFDETRIDTGITKTKTVARGSWAQWCSRTKAEASEHADPAESPAEEQERIADEILAETEEGIGAAE